VQFLDISATFSLCARGEASLCEKDGSITKLEDLKKSRASECYVYECLRVYRSSRTQGVHGAGIGDALAALLDSTQAGGVDARAAASGGAPCSSSDPQQTQTRCHRHPNGVRTRRTTEQLAKAPGTMKWRRNAK